MIWVMSLSMSTPLTKAKFLFSETSITSRFLHSRNGLASIEITELGILIDLSRLQKRNAPSPILVTKSEIKMKANRVHTENK